jgi:outer membrane protein assembly factor BamD
MSSPPYKCAVYAGSSLARGLLCALLCLSPVGCIAGSSQAESPLQYSENAKQEYEAALHAFEDRNWEAVDQMMNEVRRKYGYSRFARLAELRLADANFEQEKFAEAITGYKAFVHDYPNDPEVPYARYRVAKAQYESVSQSVLLPPLEERDLASVNDALASIRSFVDDYPNSEHAVELRYMLQVVTGLLVRHELYVARFYLRRDNFKAAVMRIEFALRNFKNSGLEPEAMVLLGEVYLKEKERAKAREVLEKMLRDYPDSAFSVPARRFLGQLGEPVAKIRMPQAEPAAGAKTQ